MKVFLHPDIQNFRGRLLNAVYQVSANGVQVKRNFVQPANPSTQYQDQVRASFGTLAGEWNTVSASEALGWGVLADHYGRFNPNGTSYPMTALSAFIMVNMMRALDGQALTTTAPAAPGLGSVAFIAATVEASGDLSLTMTDLDVGSFLYKVRVTPVIPAPYVITRGSLRFPTIDPADSIVAGTPAAQSVTLTIPAASLRTDGPAVPSWANTNRIGVNVQKLTTDYAPQTTFGQFTEDFVSVI